MPFDESLMRELRELATSSHLSQADVHRQALRFGLPRVREALLSASVSILEPIPHAELTRYYSRPDDFEATVTPEHLRASLPKEEPS